MVRYVKEGDMETYKRQWNKRQKYNPPSTPRAATAAGQAQLANDIDGLANNLQASTPSTQALATASTQALATVPPKATAVVHVAAEAKTAVAELKVDGAEAVVPPQGRIPARAPVGMQSVAITLAPGKASTPPAGTTVPRRAQGKSKAAAAALVVNNNSAGGEVDEDVGKAVTSAEKQLKNLMQTISNSSMQSGEILQSIEQDEDWKWMCNLPQVTEFRQARNKLEAAKAGSRVVKEIHHPLVIPN